jgi:hypothetical protein
VHGGRDNLARSGTQVRLWLDSRRQRIVRRGEGLGIVADWAQPFNQPDFPLRGWCAFCDG